MANSQSLAQASSTSRRRFRARRFFRKFLSSNCEFRLMRPKLPMTSPIPPLLDLDELPNISQTLNLTCVACGKRHAYDVGRVYFDREGEGKSEKYEYAFTRYFRCRDCDSAGPWELNDSLKMARQARRAGLGRSAPMVYGRIRLFDGTFMQTPAIGQLVEMRGRSAEGRRILREVAGARRW
jgi:hypothetical protein